MNDIAADPFGERRGVSHRREFSVLGARLTIDSNSRELMAVATTAFGKLPRHEFPSRVRLRVSLILDDSPERRMKTPPRMRLSSGAGLLHGVMGDSLVVIAPAQRYASVVVTRELLRFPYHLRYEVIEFVVLTLAARTQELVPLHAECVGRRGQGILLLGDSGAGKSTLSLLCALEEFQFVAEDSVFVAPDTMRATGLPNYLHVQAGSLPLVPRAAQRAAIRRSPVIRRRSGAEKFTYDLREAGLTLAPRPLKLRAVVRLTPTRHRELLRRMDRGALLKYLRATQPYARGLPEWRAFERGVAKLPAFSLARSRDPADGLATLDRVLAERS
jgi:hypothetical protein